jgi:Holliday junction resolvase RusA-like endonuclease
VSDIIILPNIPFPPSVNAAYAYSRYKDRLVRSKSHCSYEREFQVWRANHRQLLRDAGNALRGHRLRLDLAFYCATDTKSGDVRKLDVSNRIKLVEDQLSRALGIDDSYIFVITAVKRDGPPRVDAKLRAILP